MALRSDGTVVAWGSNLGGMTGNVVSNQSTVPAGLSNVVAIAAGGYHNLAVKSDGAVVAWGRNFEGQVGDGTFAQRDRPVLALNPTATGALDLLPEIGNSIPAARIPPFFVATFRSGDPSRISLSVDIRGRSPGETPALAMLPGRFAAAYNVYVAASVPSGGTATYFQLDSRNSWSALQWPMAEFMRGVALDSSTAIVTAQILQNADLSQLGGAEIIVGYGTDPDEMLRGARYRTIFTVPKP